VPLTGLAWPGLGLAGVGWAGLGWAGLGWASEVTPPQLRMCVCAGGRAL
jgi:hypothetical protein